MGGIEAFIMNVLRTLPLDDFAFDIFTTWSWNSSYDVELSERGVQRSFLFENTKSNLFRRSIEGVKGFARALDERRYDAVHINTMNGFGFAYAECARRKGIQQRIVHSHNSSFGEGSQAIKKLVHECGKLLFERAATDRLACSHEAGEYLFGHDFLLLPNGVDDQKFSFSRQYRSDVRDQLGITDGTLLLGSMGRMSAAKNPMFQIEVFRKAVASDARVRCLMIGAGEMDNEVQRRIEALGLQDVIIRIPQTSCPEKIYSALDALLMPSLHEGLPMVLVEAQCAGLPIVASDAISKDATITDLLRQMSLSDGCEEWAQALLTQANANCARERFSSIVQEGGFDLRSLGNRLEEVYRSKEERISSMGDTA